MMKEPDPTDDLERTILETFDKMHAEAQVTPIFLTFPLTVIESVRAYAKEHFLEPGTLIPLAIKALENRLYAKRASTCWKIPIRSIGLWKIL